MEDFIVHLKLDEQWNLADISSQLSAWTDRRQMRDSFAVCRMGQLVLFDGICLNKRELTSSRNWRDYASEALCRNPLNFLKKADGYYRGLIVDERSRKLEIFTDHLSSMPLYYSLMNDHLFVGTDAISLARALRANELPVSFSDFGVFCMLSYSFMVGSTTPFDCIWKTPPATWTSFPNGKSIEYFSWLDQEKTMRCSLDEIARGINRLFADAVARNFACEPKGSHILMLSGGLDSRMILLYANKLGFTHITTLNYSQSGYRESEIAKLVAKTYGCNHIFYSLDGGDYLNNIDDGIKATQGMTTYRPIVSARSIWHGFDFGDALLIHNGLLGDTIIGGYCVDKCNSNNRFASGVEIALGLNPKNREILKSPLLEEATNFFEMFSEWISLSDVNEFGQEEFVLKNRYLNGLVHSCLGLRGMSSPSFPFASRELLRYIYSYPSDIRRNHRLYFAWMKNHMPEAMRFRWENTGLPPRIGPISIKPHSVIAEAARRVDSLLRIGRPEASRNPYRYWISKNSEILNTLKTYCSERVTFLERESTFYKYALVLMGSDDIYNLTRLATLLGTMQMSCED